MARRVSDDKKLQAYIVGLALGDGNLSNSNGRAVRLRITCDKKYPKLQKHIAESIQKLLPDNKVSIVYRKDNANDVSCYSNSLEEILGWKSGKGSKIIQKVRIPSWILKDEDFIKECLRGIIQTDGSIFKDRGYIHVNIVSHIPTFARTIMFAIEKIGYKPNMQIFKSKTGNKYTIRVSKDTRKFIKDIEVWKS
jgi:DNA-binding transcriptional regulator WhiA